MWQLNKIWNDCLQSPEARTIVARDYAYASELGGSYIDRYLKMNGMQYTNPPSVRSLRKFEVGNLIEWVVKMVLVRVSIMRETQTRANYQLSDNLISVHGKLDFIAGGKINLNEAFEVLEKLELPEFFTRAARSIIANMEGKDLIQCILEVKSVSLLVYDNFVNKKMRPQHSLQTTHYSLALKMPAKILYVCKDDLRLAEYDMNFDDGKAVELYKEDVTQMTFYYKEGVLPPKEKPIVFDFDNFRFYKNWKFAYSNYLTYLYGYKDESEVQDAIGTKPTSYTRVFKRIVNGDKLTPANKEVIGEFEQILPDYERQAELAQIAGIKNDETE